MKMEISEQDLYDLVARQLKYLFILDRSEQHVLREAINNALRRVERCFADVKNKYYRSDGKIYFSPFHSGQNTVFLYFLSNTLRGADKKSTLPDRVYYLNKCLNSLDLFYEVNMPNVFFTDHPVGTVIGRAKYGDFFTFSQNCTVGNNHGKYPIIGNHVHMFSNSKVIGSSEIGDYSLLSANSFVKDENIPPYSLVIGSSPNLVIKKISLDYYKKLCSFFI